MRAQVTSKLVDKGGNAWQCIAMHSNATKADFFRTFKTLSPFLVAAMRPSAAPVDSNAPSTKRSSEAAFSSA